MLEEGPSAELINAVGLSDGRVTQSALGLNFSRAIQEVYKGHLESMLVSIPAVK